VGGKTNKTTRPLLFKGFFSRVLLKDLADALRCFVALLLIASVATAFFLSGAAASDVDAALPKGQTSQVKNVKHVNLVDSATRIDLGACVLGQVLEVQLELSNATQRSIEIVEASLSCGCLEVHGETKNVPAGSVTNMYLKVAVPSSPGAFRQRVTLKLKSADDGPGESSHEIQIAYHAAPDVELVSQVNRWIVSDSESADSIFILELLAHHGIDLSDVDVVCDTEQFSILKSVGLTSRGSETSRRVIIAQLKAGKDEQIPRAVSFFAKRRGSDTT